jgi:hypothetical protein
MYLMPVGEGVRFNECTTEMTVVLRRVEQVITLKMRTALTIATTGTAQTHLSWRAHSN